MQPQENQSAGPSVPEPQTKPTTNPVTGEKIIQPLQATDKTEPVVPLTPGASITPSPQAEPAPTPPQPTAPEPAQPAAVSAPVPATPAMPATPPNEPPAPAPTAPIAPAAPVTPAPVQPNQNPAQPPQTPGQITPLTQADFLAMAKKNKRPKRIILSIVIIAVLLGVGYFVYASGLLGGMKTVKYDNGKGKTFSLKFYSQNEIKPLKTSSPDDGSDSGKAITAKKGKDGKAPLSVYISSVKLGSSDISATSQNTIDQNSKCLGKSPVVKAQNAWANKEVYVCDLDDGSGLHYIYFSTFKNSDTLIYAMFTQDIDYNSIGDSPEKAKALLKTVGLEVYNDDIQQIVASIKPE